MASHDEKGHGIKEGLILGLVFTILLAVFSVVTGAFGITEAWAGFLFFWYFSSVRKFEKDSILIDVINSLVGIGLSYGVYLVLGIYGKTVFEGVILFVLLIILFFSVTKLIPYFIGDATFLYFTVLTSHVFLVEANYAQIVISYLCGVVFFTCTLLLTFRLLQGKKKSESTAE